VHSAVAAEENRREPRFIEIIALRNSYAVNAQLLKFHAAANFRTRLSSREETHGTRKPDHGSNFIKAVKALVISLLSNLRFEAACADLPGSSAICRLYFPVDS
jgi:hypothetical protein